MRGSRRAPRASWRIGVDLGGTWVRVLAKDGRGRRRTSRAPTPGIAGLPGHLRLVWRRWGLDRADVAGLVVASRGVWTPAERTALARRLASLAARAVVVSDAEAAHRGALADRPGVLLLAGTGSMALARGDGGRWARAGGLGPLLGDEGSAFWLGREWLRTSTGPGEFLALRRLLRAPDPVARIAALAPSVLRRASTSARARAIVARGQEALADLVVAAAREARLRSPVAVSWSGGLLDDARHREGVWRAARRRGLRVAPTPPREGPLAAALDLARIAVRGDARAPQPSSLAARYRFRGASPSAARRPPASSDG